MKLRKMLLIGALSLGMAGSVALIEPITSVDASSNIAIDGNFSDWQNADLTEGYSGYMAMKSDGQYVDVYVKMKNGQVPGYGDYNFTINNKTYYVSSNNIPSNVDTGDAKQVTFNGGDWNEGDQYGQVATGYVSSEDGNGIAEFRVDLSKFNLPDSAVGQKISMSNPNIGSDSVSATVDAVGSSSTSDAGVITDKGDTNEKGDTPTDANADNTNDNLNINIDGKYQDWKNMKLTEGYNGYTAMVSDGNYVYVYVKMKYGNFPGYGDYNFDIGGKKVYVWSSEDTNVASGQTKTISFTGGDYNEGNQYGTVGNGYITNDGKNNIGEFKVDLTKFKISNMAGQTITMYNPNIGNEKVTTAGGSTGPILISGVGVLIAGFGYIKLKKAGYLSRKESNISGK
ncbi:Firmicu-CTERM sorting domain-containing protein [Companilactobacillus jidongensis]|uniref:Firmicu-CTERM sorting domain-containing protein n=1 Tax=Companilactobacillus jidongensis TaxID=2486006 RepID=UPI000F77FF26|nr:Firmicu-CTERM sorting domain-containing protein [Companilactobacillus jidongensis]